ncbi:MAG: hypothetical protein C5B52_15970 [Bacteroidetes bacterium]|nr:MAG: hypothetical protein C5B52_15970 [Bacteroidota bacterium]
MKKGFLLSILLSAGILATAQSGSSKAVIWNFSSKKIADNTYEVRMTASINAKYHMYAQNVGVEGPVATTFKFTKNPLVAVDGKVKEEGKLVQKREEVWGGNVNYYEKSVDFVQVVKLKGKVKTNLAGSVEFMVCDDKQCLPPSEVEFKVNIGG